MIFTIKRTYKDKGTPGKLYHNNQLFCYTIERPKTGEYPCIPEGTYQAFRYDSPKHGPDTWQLENVPGRSHIQFHICKGKSGFLDYVRPHFLLGCIGPGTALGERHGEPAVTGSIEAYQKFMDLTKDEKEITFVIEEE